MSQGRKQTNPPARTGVFRQARVGQGAGDPRIRRVLASVLNGDDLAGLVKLDDQGRITVDEEALKALTASDDPGTEASTNLPDTEQGISPADAMNRLQDLDDTGRLGTAKDGDGIAWNNALQRWDPFDSSALIRNLESIRSTGILTGGQLTLNADGTSVDIVAGTGQVYDPGSGQLTPVSWLAKTLAITNIATTILTNISIDIEGEFVQTKDKDPDFDDYLVSIQLGRAGHRGPTTLSSISTRGFPCYDIGGTLRDIFLSLTPRSTSGNVYGAASTDLTLIKTAGTSLALGRGYATDTDTPNRTDDQVLDPVVFTRVFDDGTHIDVSLIPGVTDIDPANYDDTSGTLASVPAGKWTVQKIFFAPGSDATAIFYGSVLYNNISDAKSGASLEGLPANTVTNDLIHRAFLFVKGNASDLSNTAQAEFAEVSGTGGGSTGSAVATTLQVSYDNSGIPQIELNAIAGTMTIADAPTPIATTLFEVTDNSGAISFLAVDSGGINVAGAIVATSTVSGSNLSGTNTGDEPAADLTTPGVVELATIAETDTGTDATRALTPAGLAGSALQATADSALQTADINTLAELNAIVADATLIDTTDSRLSDARTPTAHTHLTADITDLDTDLATLALPANTTISVFGASLIDDLLAANARTTLGLGALATLNTVGPTEIATNAVTITKILDGNVSLAKISDIAQGETLGRGVAAGTGKPTALDGPALTLNLYADVGAHSLLTTSTTTGSATIRLAGLNTGLVRGASGDLVFATYAAGNVFYNNLAGGGLQPTSLGVAIKDQKMGRCFQVSGEEGANMSTSTGGGYQYSSGNGSVGSTHGYVAPFNCELYAITASTFDATNTSTIAVRIDATTTLNSITMTGKSTSKLSLSDSVTAGAKINLQTTAVGGGVGGPHLITAFFVEV